MTQSYVIWIAFLLFVQLHHSYSVTVTCANLQNSNVCECEENPENYCEFVLEVEYQPRVVGGVSRNVVTINDNFPGPTLIVREGQYVKVLVMNRLGAQYPKGITIHWHGMHQVGTPWLDGVGNISQTPIAHNEDFTYFFRPYDPTPSGTHWYHSHVGEVRTMGLFGALIVREPRRYFETVTRLISDGTPLYGQIFGDTPDVHTLTLLDWLNGKSHAFSLINGKGNVNPANPPTEFAEFTVARGQAYRFRVVGAQNKFPHKLSIDNHKLLVVASDGHFFEPEEVDFLVVHSGERYDFIVRAVENGTLFWIRASPEGAEQPVPALAKLYYGSSTGEMPQTTERDCTVIPCKTLNCLTNEARDSECIPLHNLTALLPEEDTRRVPQVSGIDDMFFNFDFEGLIKEGEGRTASVNGKNFEYPATPYQTTCGQHDLDKRDDATCARVGPQEQLECTHVKTIAKGSNCDLDNAPTVVMVFSSLSNETEAGKAASHPVHLHGHSFYILHIGYGMDNMTNSEDIKCEWKNRICKPSWNEENGQPSTVLEAIRSRMVKSHIRKDTVIVPARGYVVVAFRANNPGYWFLHCHIEGHLTAGMAVIIEECPDKQLLAPDELGDDWSIEAYKEFVNAKALCPSTGGARVDKAAPIAITIIALVAGLLVML